MFATLKKLKSDIEGGTMAVFAIALPVLVGAVAVSVEAGYWSKSKKDVQLLADMASYAGAKELETQTNEQAEDAAKLDAINNGFNFDTGTIEVNSPPLSGAYAGQQAVEVIIVQQGLKFFSGVVSDEPIQYRVRSVSAVLENTEVCALALNTSSSRALYATGSSTLDLQGCDLGSNSTSSTAIFLHGSSNTTADCLHTAGSISGGGTVNLECNSGNDNASVINDPYDYLTTPDLDEDPFDDCKTRDSASGSHNYTLDEGRYCSDFTVRGTNELTGGTYVFDGIDVRFQGNTGSLIGSDVTIILMNGATFSNLNGGADLILSAPTDASDPYRGVAIYSDPDTQTAGQTMTMVGGSSSSIEGLVYMPNQNVEFGGNSSGTSECTLIVSDTIEFRGNASLEMTGCQSTYGLANPSIVGTFIVE